MNIPSIFQKVLTLWKLLYRYGWVHISLRYHNRSNLYVLLDFWNKINPTGNYMFKVSNKNSRARCEICSKLTIKTPETTPLASFLVSLLLTLNIFHTLFHSVFIVIFEQVIPNANKNIPRVIPTYLMPDSVW